MGRYRAKVKMLAPPATKVTSSHLAHELVHADWVLHGAETGLMSDLAVHWAEYAEDVRDWRYALLREFAVYNLYQCGCGRVLQFQRKAHCFSCGKFYRKA